MNNYQELKKREKPLILIVDDVPQNLQVLGTLLRKKEYDLSVATDGEQALQIAGERLPDLVLLDVMMPGLDGFEVCKILKNSDKTKRIPVIFLTARAETEDIVKGFELGAVDYVTKPINSAELLTRVQTHIELKQYQEYLEELVNERTAELKKSYEQLQNAKIVTILGLAKLAEYRDEDTGDHLERIREFSRIIAYEMSKKEKYKGYITPEYIDDIYNSAVLHDIGKVGIPDSILLKPGKLTPEEFEAIKIHPALGGDAIKAIEKQIQGRSFLTLGKEIAYYHHEKWNGKGYPKGLKGDNIPLSARIVALTDVYDALTSKRVYKDAFSHEKATNIIISEKGEHFDPDVVDSFIEREKDFRKIRESIKVNEKKQKEDTHIG